ncbi:oxidoreductase [Simiduia curdlanivorans]|uniref:Oxidoreductase n=1 Tax=Simiduia curdlanivorans TaxID=1492769 RepID=A0ABV8V207_9GAMM|nr:oxidoreductase [Simiduia curdlanivorans]MDN3637891.1 oxidoreductase [Simiduia curdlanivorans]
MIKVGLIGFGYAAKTFHLPLIEASAAFQLTAISSSQSSLILKRHPALEIYPTALQLIESKCVDLVIITAPNHTHFSLAKAALDAGLHVLIEKPMTHTAAEAMTLCVLAKSRGRVLTVFHNRRWDGDFLTVQKLIANNALGKLKVFESHFDRFRPEVRDRWRENPGLGAGIWYDLGSHLVDQALTLFGAPTSITARLKMLRENSRNVDYFHVQLHYPSHEVILHSSPFSAGPNLRFQLSGTTGSFIKRGLDPQEDQLKSGLLPSAADYGIEANQFHGTLYTNSSSHIEPTLAGDYLAFYHALADAITKGSAVPVDPVSAAQVIHVIEQAVRADREGRTLAFAGL